jgi:hypothetical protein
MGMFDDLPSLPSWLPEDPTKNAAARAGLLNFGAALLGGRGNIGQILGGGLAAGAQGYNGSLEQQQQAGLAAAQQRRWDLENQQTQAAIDEPAQIASIFGGSSPAAPSGAPTPPSDNSSAALAGFRSPAPSWATGGAGFGGPDVSGSTGIMPLSTLPQVGAPSTTLAAVPASQPPTLPDYQQMMDWSARATRAGKTALAKQYYDMAIKSRPEVQEVKTALDASGKPVQVITFKDGTQQTSAYGALPDNQIVDLGSSQALIDKNTGKQGATFSKAVTPGEQLQHTDQVAARAQAQQHWPADQNSNDDTPFMRELAAQYPKGSPEYDEALRQRINKEAGINSGGGGGRSVVYNGRIIASGNEVAQALRNITDLPVTSNAGLFGMGGAQNSTLLGATMAGLKNKLNSDQIKSYNTMWTGVSRNLGTLETSGLATTGDLIKSIDKLQFVDGDNGYNALRKLAEVRQITEAALEPKLHDPAVPGQQRQYIQGVIDAVHNAVPYTHADLTKYDRAAQKNPGISFSDFAAQTVSKPKIAPLSQAPKLAPAAGIQPYADPGKEARYQAWKRSQGQ